MLNNPEPNGPLKNLRYRYLVKDGDVEQRGLQEEELPHFTSPASANKYCENVAMLPLLVISRKLLKIINLSFRLGKLQVEICFALLTG